MKNIKRLDINKIVEGDFDWILQENTPLISDTHFFHKNIQRYCNRPDNWQQTIITNWNKMIAPKQKVLHLGDFYLGPREEETFLQEHLNGEIFIVFGNHDRKNSLFWSIIRGDILLELPEYYLVISHIPMLLPPKKKQKPLFNLHGHVHNNPHPETDDIFHINLSVEVNNYSPVLMREIRQEILKRIDIFTKK